MLHFFAPGRRLWSMPRFCPKMKHAAAGDDFGACWPPFGGSGATSMLQRAATLGDEASFHVGAYADGVASAVGFGDDEVCAEVFDEAKFGGCCAF